jgi:hypothetical protein
MKRQNERMATIPDFKRNFSKFVRISALLTLSFHEQRPKLDITGDRVERGAGALKLGSKKTGQRLFIW